MEKKYEYMRDRSYNSWLRLQNDLEISKDDKREISFNMTKISQEERDATDRENDNCPMSKQGY